MMMDLAKQGLNYALRHPAKVGKLALDNAGGVNVVDLMTHSPQTGGPLQANGKYLDEDTSGSRFKGLKSLPRPPSSYIGR